MGMLAVSGRVTMLEIARWAGEGGSYRTVQRFFNGVFPWAVLLWVFFRGWVWRSQETYLLAGDKVVVSKAGKKTHGDRFFSGLYGKPIAGVAFLVLLLVSVEQRHRSPKETTDEGRGSTGGKKRGRPKVSPNCNKRDVVLSEELRMIQRIASLIPLRYVLLDGYFGHHAALPMARQLDLHLNADQLLGYYSLRFQIEFHFRDTKQFWGLEDFMNIAPTPLTNAVNLSFLMVNLSTCLLQELRTLNPQVGIVDLKAYYRGIHYAHATIKLLPIKLAASLVDTILAKVTAIGRIHPLSKSSTDA